MTSTVSADATGLSVSRTQLERMIEDAIGLLDLLDADPDLEENGDLEPSIGTCVRGVVDAEGDDADDEPWLGSLDRRVNQTKWAGDSSFCVSSDNELDRSDDEPSLGSPVGGIGNQEHWAQGCDRDDDRVAPAVKAQVISRAKKRRDRHAGATPQEKLPTPDDPGDLPEVYGMGVEGDCMVPEIYSGSRVAASRSEPYAVGDLIAVWFRPEYVKPGGHKAIVKRLAMAPPPWVRFPYREHPQSELQAMIGLSMNNPPGSSFIVRCTHILAVHRVVGMIPVERATSPDARYELFGRPLSGPAAKLLPPKTDAPLRKVAAKRVVTRKAVRP